MNRRQLRHISVFLWVLVFVLVLELFDTIVFGQRMNNLGVVPRDWRTLPCIWLMPFLHGGLAHLLENFVVILIFGCVIIYFRRDALSINFWIITLTGVFVWLIGRSTFNGQITHHIGASGIAFGYLGYLLTETILGRFRYIPIVAITVAMFVAIAPGMVPKNPGVSWEGHVFGLVSGVIVSLWFANEKRKQQWTD